MHDTGETLSLDVIFKIHHCYALHRGTSWSWFQVSVQIPVISQVVIINNLWVFYRQQHRLHEVELRTASVPQSRFPRLVETIAQQQRGVHTFSFPSVCGHLVSRASSSSPVVDSFTLPHLRWREIGGAAPETNKRWGHRRHAHLSQQSAPSAQAGNGFNRR